MGRPPGLPSSHHNSGRPDGRLLTPADDLSSLFFAHSPLVDRNSGRPERTSRLSLERLPGRPLL